MLLHWPCFLRVPKEYTGAISQSLVIHDKEYLARSFEIEIVCPLWRTSTLIQSPNPYKSNPQDKKEYKT